MLVQTLILAAGVFAATNYKSSTAYKCLATGVSPFYTLKESLTETNVNFLKENEIKSAFFIDETWIQSKKNVLDLIKNEGHEIGLYRSGDKWGGFVDWTTGTISNEDGFREQINAAVEAIQSKLSVKVAYVFFDNLPVNKLDQAASIFQPILCSLGLNLVWGASSFSRDINFNNTLFISNLAGGSVDMHFGADADDAVTFQAQRNANVGNANDLEKSTQLKEAITFAKNHGRPILNWRSCKIGACPPNYEDSSDNGSQNPNLSDKSAASGGTVNGFVGFFVALAAYVLL